jgi:hypothetical protein
VDTEKLRTVLYEIIMNSESEEYERIKQNVSNKEELIQFIQQNCIIDHEAPEETFKLPLGFLEGNKLFYDNDCKVTMPKEMHALLMELFADCEEDEQTFE